MPKPLFISFEGIDGSGKSTQAIKLFDHLIYSGVPAILVREPGYTPLGEHLREYLKGQEPLTPVAELLLFEAARAQLVVTVIAPALRDGTTVITDRYTDSTFAYQGAGRGLDPILIRSLNSMATRDLFPDITFLLSIDPSAATARTNDRNARFEAENRDFYNRVATAYAQQAKAQPHRIQTLDATLPEADLAESIRTVTTRNLTTRRIEDPTITPPGSSTGLPQKPATNPQPQQTTP